MSTGSPAKCTGMMARVLRRDGGRHLIEIDVAREQVDIDEHRLGAHARNHIGARRETHGRNDHFVPRADPRHFERHLEAGGGRGHHAHMAPAAQVGRERALESLHLRPAGQLAGAEYLGDGRDALRVDGGAGKGKKGCHAELLETRTTPAQIRAMPSTLAGAMPSPSHSTDTTATTT